MRLSRLIAPALMCLPYLHAAPQPASAQAKPAAAAPLFELERGSTSLVWERGDNGGLEASATLRRPTLRVVREASAQPGGEKDGAPPPAAEAREADGLTARIERVAIHDGALLYMEGDTSGRELLAVRDLEMTIENFATDRAGSGGLPTLVTGRGRIGREGSITFFVSALPWSERPDLSGRAEIVGLGLAELGAIATVHAGLLPSVGTLSAVTEFSIDDGRISGGVAPTLEGVAADWLGSAEGWLEQQGLDLFADGEDGEEKQQVVLPLGGTVSDPEAGIGAAIVDVLQQALVRSVTIALPEVPPELEQLLPPGIPIPGAQPGE